MPLVFSLVNAGKSPVTLYLMGREPRADFRVSDAAGRRVWSLLWGETIVASLQVVPVEPGKGLTFRQIWNQRTDGGRLVPPGNYLLRAVLLTDRPEGLTSPEGRLRIDR